MLKVLELTKEYQVGDRRIAALDHVSFTLETGKIAAVVGRSGSGKSTLLHLLGALDEPTSGSVSFDETEYSSLSIKERDRFRRDHIGYVFQNFQLIDELTAEENILFAAEIAEIKPDMDAFEELVLLLGLEERLHHRPRQLSGGEQQRVAIARAMIKRPRLLLMDEPTGNLDNASALRIGEIIRACSTVFGQTVVVATHDPELARCGDLTLALSDGRIDGGQAC